MSGKDKKFMFDLNVFDEDHVEEEENLPPPPPTFSEAELEAARAAGYEQGYAKAQEDERGGREQAITTTLSRIAKEITPLMAAEAEREKRFEQEAVHLTLHIFKTLYPHYAKECGFGELQAMLSSVLGRNRSSKTVQVYVSKDMVEGVSAHLNHLTAQNADLSFEINVDPALEDTSCRLSWVEGGAQHQPQKIAQYALDILSGTLSLDGYAVENPQNLQDKLTEGAKGDIVDEGAAVLSEAAQEDNQSPDLPPMQGENEE